MVINPESFTLQLPGGMEWVFIAVIIGAIAIVGIIFAIIAVIRWLGKRIPKSKSNLDILKNRLAKGEITKEEYDKLKKEFE